MLNYGVLSHPHDVCNFIRDNNLQKEDIISITYDALKRDYVVFYWIND